MTAFVHDTLTNIGETQSHVPVSALIETALQRFEQASDEEVDRQLEVLIITAKRLQLPDYAKHGQMAEYIATVPGASELVQKIHETADQALHNKTLQDESAPLLINNLGVAADVTQDKSIIAETLHAIEDTTDHRLDMLKTALEVALDDGASFTDSYRRLKMGKPALATTHTFVPMSKRPDFPADDPFAQSRSDKQYQRFAPGYEPDVKMQAVYDIYGELRNDYVETNPLPFTTEDIKRTTIMRALGDFATRSKRR